LDKLIYGMQVTLIGMGIVFIILFLLSLFMDLMKKVFHKEQPAAEQQPVKSTLPRGTAAMPESGSHQQRQVPSEELIAVLAAAIAHTTGQVKPFMITRVRRIHTRSPLWSLASRGNLPTLNKTTSTERRKTT